MPDNVPVTCTPEANWASPVTVRPLATERFPVTARIGIFKVWKVPVVASTVVPVIVVPLKLINVPEVASICPPVIVVPDKF